MLARALSHSPTRPHHAVLWLVRRDKLDCRRVGNIKNGEENFARQKFFSFMNGVKIMTWALAQALASFHAEILRALWT